MVIDLHDSIIQDNGKILQLRDMLNPCDRPPSTVPAYMMDPKRQAPEPPRFATKFLDEFSSRQTNLRDFFKGKSKSSPTVSPSAVDEVSPVSPPSRPSSGHSQSTLAPLRVADEAFRSMGRHGDSKEAESTSNKTDKQFRSSASAQMSQSKPIRSAKAGGQTRLSSFFRQNSTPADSPMSSLPPTLPIDDESVARAIAEADAERETKRIRLNAEAAPVWSNLFAKKLPPMCTVHQRPCKDFSEYRG